MSLSRKHYKAISNILDTRLAAAKGSGNQDTIEAIRQTAEDLSCYFKTDNQAFQRDRFLEACGIQ